MPRVPVQTLRRIPVVRVLAVAELLMLARQHYLKLGAGDRRRLLELVKRGRRPSRLSQRERMELAALVAKAEPRLFAQLAAEKLIGVKLPHGQGQRRFGRK